MTKRDEGTTPTEMSDLRQTPTVRPKGWFVAQLVLLALFALPLWQLATYTIGQELYSHVVLIPLISGYLAWQTRVAHRQLPHSSPNRALAVAFWTAGLAAGVGYMVLSGGAPSKQPDDVLAAATLSYLLLFVGTCAWFFGRNVMRSLAFPLGFLAFMVPFPTFALNAVEAFLQHGSAAVAHAMFVTAGTSVFVDGLVFQLPGITIQVAPECSGIHSSLALLITSVLAGYYFLRSPTRRAILALAVIPLALLRNGFRVFVIGELCVHIRPEMIDSYIHHHGGPIFFVASLFPFFLLLLFLVRRERRPATT